MLNLTFPAHTLPYHSCIFVFFMNAAMTSSSIFQDQHAHNFSVNIKVCFLPSLRSCVPQHCGSTASLGRWSQTQRSPDHWALMENWGAAITTSISLAALPPHPILTHPHTSKLGRMCWTLRKVEEAAYRHNCTHTEHMDQTDPSTQKSNLNMITVFLDHMTRSLVFVKQTCSSSIWRAPTCESPVWAHCQGDLPFA